MDFQWSGDGLLYQQPRWISCYSSQHLILIVGDGNFSFAASLAIAFGAAPNMVATSLDSKDELLKKYGQTAECNTINLMYRGALVFHDFDACKMAIQQRYFLSRGFQSSRFHCIIFNFPHAGFLGKETDAHVLRKHRELVRNFFANAKEMLLPGGQVHVRHKLGPAWDAWKLEELADTTGLKLLGRVPFHLHQFPGYQNCRGDGFRADEPFPLGPADTYIFAVKDEEPPPKFFLQSELSEMLAPPKSLKGKALAKNSVGVLSSKTPEPLKPLVGETVIKASTSQVRSLQQDITNDEARLGEQKEKELDNEKQVENEKVVKEKVEKETKLALEMATKIKLDKETMKTSETQTSAAMESSVTNSGSIKVTNPHVITRPSQVTKMTISAVHNDEEDLGLSDPMLARLKCLKGEMIRQGRVALETPLYQVAADEVVRLEKIREQLGEKKLRTLRLLKLALQNYKLPPDCHAAKASQPTPGENQIPLSRKEENAHIIETSTSSSTEVKVSSSKTVQVWKEKIITLDTAIIEVSSAIARDSSATIINNCPDSKETAQLPSAPSDIASCELDGLSKDLQHYLRSLKEEAIRKARASEITTFAQVAVDEEARLENVKSTLGTKGMKKLKNLKSALRVMNLSGCLIVEERGSVPEEEVVPSDAAESSKDATASISEKTKDREQQLNEVGKELHGESEVCVQDEVVQDEVVDPNEVGVECHGESEVRVHDEVVDAPEKKQASGEKINKEENAHIITTVSASPTEDEVSSSKNIQVWKEKKTILDTTISTLARDSSETIIAICPVSKQNSQSPAQIHLSAPSCELNGLSKTSQIHLRSLKEKAIRKARASENTTFEQVAADEVARLEKVKSTLGTKRMKTLENLKSSLRVMNLSECVNVEERGSVPEEEIVTKNVAESSKDATASISQKIKDHQPHPNEVGEEIHGESQVGVQDEVVDPKEVSEELHCESQVRGQDEVVDPKEVDEECHDESEVRVQIEEEEAPEKEENFGEKINKCVDWIKYYISKGLFYVLQGLEDDEYEEVMQGSVGCGQCGHCRHCTLYPINMEMWLC